MKRITMAVLLAITLFSCKKTPDLVITDHSTKAPDPCSVVFYTENRHGRITITVNGVTQVTEMVTGYPDCEHGFVIGSYVGHECVYSYKLDNITGSGSLVLKSGCNIVEMK